MKDITTAENISGMELIQWSIYQLLREERNKEENQLRGIETPPRNLRPLNPTVQTAIGGTLKRGPLLKECTSLYFYFHGSLAQFYKLDRSTRLVVLYASSREIQ
jgi:hypothetical protein